jgi:hypothetical protein
VASAEKGPLQRVFGKEYLGKGIWSGLGAGLLPCPPTRCSTLVGHLEGQAPWPCSSVLLAPGAIALRSFSARRAPLSGHSRSGLVGKHMLIPAYICAGLPDQVRISSASRHDAGVIPAVSVPYAHGRQPLVRPGRTLRDSLAPCVERAGRGRDSQADPCAPPLSDSCPFTMLYFGTCRGIH